MQGVNPSEAFSSLPRSLQGMDELEDSSLLISADTASSQAWSLEREEVSLNMQALHAQLCFFLRQNEVTSANVNKYRYSTRKDK